MLYEYKYLTFPDEATQKTFFDNSDPEAPVNLYPQLNWDVIGTITEPSTYDEEGNQLTPPNPLEGWHVNIAYKWDAEWPEALNDYVIETPATPYRVRPVPELTDKQREQLTVSRLQAKMMLSSMGLLDAFESWITSAPALVQLAYNEAYRFSRKSDLWDTIKSAMGWTDLDLDRLFMRALYLEV